MIRGLSWKLPVRMASTANLTLSGLQTIDGIVGATGDRVLAKDQTAGAANGIYEMAAGAWLRSFDMDQDQTTSVPSEETLGAMVYVIAGTVNSATFWRTTNTTTPVLGTTAIAWAQFAAGAAITVKDEGTPLATAATSIDFVGAGVVASGTGAAKTVTITGGGAPTGAAGGDLSGTYPNPAVAKINGSPLGTISPSTADRLRWNGSAWVNSALIWQPLTDPSVPDLIYDAGDVVMTEA